MNSVDATNNMFAETMRYFQYLPPKRERNAAKLEKHADEAIDVFFKGGKDNGKCNRSNGGERIG